MEKNVIKNLEQEHEGRKYNFPIGAKAENIETDDERQFVSKAEKMKIGEIDTMKQSFQAGVDALYNKCKSCGATPAGKTPAAISAAIQKIYEDRYNSGYNDGRAQGRNDVISDPGEYGLATNITGTASVRLGIFGRERYDGVMNNVPIDSALIELEVSQDSEGNVRVTVPQGSNVLSGPVSDQYKEYGYGASLSN